MCLMRFRLRKLMWCAVMAALSASVASLAWANPGVVTLRDGTKYEGDVTEEQTVVTIVTRQNMRVQITREKIAKVEYTEEPELEFNKRYRDLAKDDVDARIELARFCFDHNRPDLAKIVLAEAVQLDPQNSTAASLYEAARAEVELLRRAAERTDDAPDATRPSAPRRPKPTTRERPSTGDRTSGETTPPPTRPAGNHRLLDPDQVNAVKQAELRDGDMGVTVKFDDNVEKRFAFATGRTLGALRQLAPIDRFMLMRREASPTLLKGVRILRDPAPLAEFRRIQPRILAGCASSGCHGGENTHLALVTPIDGEPAVYTNFYLLATHRAPVILASGASANLEMISRSSPETSLLLQYSLDPKIARFPHPPVPGYRPLFRSPDEPAFANMLQWIEFSLTPLTPDYGFTFEERPEPPAPPATAPALGASPLTPPSSQPAIPAQAAPSQPPAQPPAATQPAVPTPVPAELPPPR